MKRLSVFFSLILFLAMLVINLPFITAGASADEQVNVYDEQKQLVKSIVFVIGLDQYFVNGQTPGVKMDAKPFIDSGRTFVPVRYLGNALGLDNDHIAWESPRAIFKQPGFPVVELTVDSKVIKSDAAATTMDTTPLLKTGRMYLPARWVAEALGYEVAWDAQNQVVLCWPKGAEKPDVSNVLSYVKGQPVKQPPLVEQPVETPTTPEGSMKELFDKAKPLKGEPFSFSGWNFDQGIQKQLQEFWDSSGDEPIIQEITVDDLKPNGIRVSKVSGYVIHDLQVTEDGITVTATTPGKSMPKFYLVEEDNVVRYKGGGGYMGEYTGTLTQDVKYIHGSGDSFYITPDLTKATHILFEFGGELLNVKNPTYQGGN
ncbi:Copper amine oxidase N-terminal domain-containing protein [Desulfotomaculum arcticum]|uniref:Copper amine oxidase N-terminal domain-containing protein n=1 Tax=Desulfotruncus arcticus DSM 17038 TaxID=1121424 RepID=A0A1I2N148_9FIRM|nr:stalk domain-containing protein [Desulfotruncus arcticus]SFF97605.1 Copper amine oxidase N-terminal domain-containing protein [Desulfotomaculum arcticum] [Desulfotruncus arcticus DSM 17038]